MTTTESTAIGRRRGERSPRLDTNGTRSRATIKIAGKIRMMKVSVAGGLRDNRPNSHKKGHSGRGLAPVMLGSTGAAGPLGPRTAATATTAITTKAEKRPSLI